VRLSLGKKQQKINQKEKSIMVSSENKWIVTKPHLTPNEKT
jgi:hypothetical protein